VLADWRTAPVDDRVAAALALLETMTLRPDELAVSDVRRLLDAGVSEDGVVDALYVGFLFNTIDRIADALGFDTVSEEQYGKGADRLLQHGYL
jgi:alkylhydroperoxidase family enzyme